MSYNLHSTHRWRYSDSSIYDAVCENCNITDIHPLASEPCTGKEVIIGTNPLPSETQDKLWEFVNWLDANYEIRNGSTALYWYLSYEIDKAIKKPINKK